MPLQAYVSPVAAPARGCRRPERRANRGPDRRSDRDYIRQTAHRKQRRIAREGVHRREETRNRGAPPQKGHRTGPCPDRHKASEAAQAPARQRLGRSGCPPPRHKLPARQRLSAADTLRHGRSSLHGTSSRSGTSSLPLENLRTHARLRIGKPVATFLSVTPIKRRGTQRLRCLP